MATYDVSGVLPIDDLPAGTQLLALSPPLLGARTLGYRYVARGLDDGEAGIVVSTDRGADRVASAVAEHTTTDDALSRLGVVDCSGQSGETDCPVIPVGSPADLTGIGIAVSRLLDRFTEEHDRLRVALDSVSTLLVYSEFERVFRFVHAFTGRVRSAGACSLLLLQSDTDQRAVESLQGVTDGRVELRETDGGAEFRLRGPDGADDRWRPLDIGATRPGVDGSTTGRVDADVDPVASLRDLIERMAAGGLTLTVLNYTGDEETLDGLRGYFDRLNVSARTVTLPTETPTDLAVLHRETETLATNHVSMLDDWIRLNAFDETDEEPVATDLTRPDVVEQATRDEYTVANAGKLRLVRISRLLELRALRGGGGTLHTGFQRLDRIDDELGTRRLYERVADAGVDVHLYGKPGRVPKADAYTVHADEGDELADTWFVVYDGGGDAARAGALVTEETEPEHYDGFWTYHAGVAQAAIDYLGATY